MLTIDFLGIAITSTIQSLREEVYLLESDSYHKQKYMQDKEVQGPETLERDP